MLSLDLRLIFGEVDTLYLGTTQREGNIGDATYSNGKLPILTQALLKRGLSTRNQPG